MIRRSTPSFARATREGMFSHSFSNQKNQQKSMWIENSILISDHLIRRSKNLQKEVILTPLHASADHHSCVHIRKVLASVWPLDKSKQISKKSIKIAYQMQNIITKNCSNLKAFDQDKNSPKYREMQCFYTRVRETLLVSNFSLPQKFQKKIHLML